MATTLAIIFIACVGTSAALCIIRACAAALRDLERLRLDIAMWEWLGDDR